MARKKLPPDPNTPKKGRPLDLPDWFLQEITRVADKAHAQFVSDEIFNKTGQKWDRSVVGDFLHNRRATIELAEAFADTYEIPRVSWFARSLSEALAFRREAAKFQPAEIGDPASRASYDSAAEQLEKQVDQTRVVPSKNEVGIGRGRRTGRMGRGRP